MTTQSLDHASWQGYFDDVSKSLPAASVDVIVTGLDLGAQTEAEHLPLVGLTYDPRDDAFEIAMRDLSHRISRPRAIHVERDAQGLTAIEVVDRDGYKHLVQLTRALALPPD